ncbi:MAG: hypothetical protein IPL19_00580 [Sandaracinaceae bacterium]|jgi:hypothetical protein|nr:hypothetical protein [Sandaracinaceae bacterium]MBK8406453.1 hypothetical protein [Sandaracinaceae bacterium]MBP7681868.1 hypothetical protein [Deltaproteobacteria bacterium]
MDPVSVMLGAAPKALDVAMKLAGAWRTHHDAREAELRLLRVLYFEVCQNLGVLSRFHIADRAGIPSNDQAYEGIAKLLSVDAHLAVVLVRGETEAELESVRALRLAAAAQRDQSLAEQERSAADEFKRAERLAAFRSVWGDLCDESWELVDVRDARDDDAEDAGAAHEPAAAPRPSKITTVLRSLAFVSVKVPTLQTLAGVDEATRSVMRDVRTAVRLEQIRQHESALKRHLEMLPAIAPVRV